MITSIMTIFFGILIVTTLILFVITHYPDATDKKGDENE